MSKFGGFFVVSMEGVRIVRVQQKKNLWFLFLGGSKGQIHQRSLFHDCL